MSDYGVKAGDYGSVGAALLWTLEKGLGADWTPGLAALGCRVHHAVGIIVGEAYGRSVAADRHAP